ncbi:diaminopimelate epimerase [Methylomonas sp. SURF-1]|uniref:Diaminopimelate epimerase n=1 Tax=Methylomonas aurea TaxID=2952224 RepID=A0ABT1UMZ9_9GAMM|nr:diaminopimelate epimerase [Methylomonas sp. SURF-1]
MRFTKMHGLGNDFIVIDAVSQQVDLNAGQVRFLADRHFGVGCDQLLLVEKPISANADFKYRIFNSDGGEVSQCGNGARCFARFVRDKQLCDKEEIVVDTDAGQLVLGIGQDGMVRVNMGVPRHDPAQIPLNAPSQLPIYHVVVDGESIAFVAVSMGNPHAVLIVDDVEQAPVASLGRRLESHEVFPQRANIGFMQVVDRSRIKLRVYERGAAETLACGSGACAAVVAGIEQGLLDSKVNVCLPGGALQIDWSGRGFPVLMTGPAVTVFEGWIRL